MSRFLSLMLALAVFTPQAFAAEPSKRTEQADKHLQRAQSYREREDAPQSAAEQNQDAQKQLNDAVDRGEVQQSIQDGMKMMEKAFDSFK